MATTAPDTHKPRRKRVPAHEREMELMDHLSELRTRVLRSVVLIGVASCIVWYYFDPLYAFFTIPIAPYLKHGNEIVVTNWLEPFFIHLKLSLYGGIVVSAPFWIMEMWGFVAPALTPEERKPIRLIAPMTVVLFALGVLLAHVVLPLAFRWSLSYLPPNVQLMQHASEYVELLAKMYLAFGLCFELPVVLMFLAKVGLINAALMKLYWRQAVLVIMIVAAVVTPSNDPVTMLMCAIPMAFLYLLSISLVSWMERSAAREHAAAPERPSAA